MLILRVCCFAVFNMAVPFPDLLCSSVTFFSPLAFLPSLYFWVSSLGCCLAGSRVGGCRVPGLVVFLHLLE